MNRRRFLKLTTFALAAAAVPSATKAIAEAPKPRIAHVEYLLDENELILGGRNSQDEDFIVTRTGTVASLYLWYEPMGMYLKVPAEALSWAGYGWPGIRPWINARDTVQLGPISIRVGE